MTHTQEHPRPDAAAAYYSDRPVAAARDLTALGVLAFAAAAVATVSTCAAALVLGRASRLRAEQGLEAVDWSLAVYYAATVLGFVALALGWVTASLWLHRARRNAEALDPSAPHALAAGWAWGGWVTPVVALWFPFLLVRDVRRATTPRAPSALLGCWWALFLAVEVGTWASFNLQGSALASFQHAALAQRVSVVTAALMVAALAAWGQVLWAVTAEQHARMRADR